MLVSGAGNEPEGDSLKANQVGDGVSQGHLISHSLLRTRQLGLGVWDMQTARSINSWVCFV